MPSLRRLLPLLALATFATACGPQDESTRDPFIFSQQQGLSACGQVTVKGIDVSAYQGSYQGSGVHVNWNQVAGAGYKFAVARISDGTATPDPDFTYNWNGIKAAGMVRGAYQFFRPSADVTAQANLVVSKVGRLGDGDLPVTLDVEVATPTKSQIIAWANIVEQGTGKKPLIYTASGLWNQWLPNGGLESYPLWAANYVSCTPNSTSCCPSMPHNWSAWVIWQYTSSNNGVPGINGNVDTDFWNGSLAELQTFAGTTDCGGKADGTWCGGNGPTGPTDTLYTCAGNVATVEETCPGWCVTGTSGDFCARSHRPALATDVDGDGKADVCGRNASGLKCWLGSGTDFATAVTGPAIADGSGWSNLIYYTTTQFADVNGDGKADFCARGAAGAMCWLGTGSDFGNATSQTHMSNADGWNKPEYRQTIQWADVNNDGKADLCGRQYGSFSCWLYDSASNAFTTEVDVPDMGDPQGWNQVQYYSTIVVADVTGDGRADVCGRGYAGFECFTAKSNGFNAAGAAVTAFSDPNGGDSASVYATIALGDVTGDGKPDVCGRISAGYRCYQGNGDGTFSATAITGPALSNASSWNKPQYYSTIQLSDINGDGKADVCGRSSTGLQCWLSTGTGFGSAITGPALSNTAGWSDGTYGTSIHFADVDGDGRADVCARAASGLSCWLSTGNGFAATPIDTTVFGTAGWEAPKDLTTIQLLGNAFGQYVPGTSTTSSTGSSGSTGAASTTGSGPSGSTASGGTSGSDATGSTGGTSTGTSGGEATTTTGGAGAAGTTGSTDGGAPVGGGCASTSGGELFALFAALGLIRRRR